VKPSDIWKLDLDYRAKVVLLALLDYGVRAWPRQSTLSTKCGMGRRTLQRTLDELRESGRIATKTRGKSLTYYIVDLRQSDASTCATGAPEMRLRGAGTGASVAQGSELVHLTHPPNQASADALGGWEVEEQVANRIRQRDPRADIKSHSSVCRRVLISHGLSDRDALGAWRLLLEHWARSGNDAYSTLKFHTENLGGARDVAKVVLHRLQGVA